MLSHSIYMQTNYYLHNAEISTETQDDERNVQQKLESNEKIKKNKINRQKKLYTHNRIAYTEKTLLDKIKRGRHSFIILFIQKHTKMIQC